MKHLFLQLSTAILLFLHLKKKKAPKLLVKLDLHRFPHLEFLKYAAGVYDKLKGASYPVCEPELQNLSKEIAELQFQMTEWQNKELRRLSTFDALRNAREKVYETIKLLYIKSGMFQNRKPSPPFPLPKLPVIKMKSPVSIKD